MSVNTYISAHTASLRIVCALLLVLGGFSLTSFYLSNLKHPDDSVQSASKAAAIVSTKAATPQQLRSGVPVKLAIASVGIRAEVAHAGLTSAGAMDIEQDPDKLAWYKFGTRPGDEGSAVIAGHYGWLNGRSAAFNNLQRLKKGDEVKVTDKDNITTTFVVRTMRKYDPAADATDIFTSKDGGKHLNLITCDGTWNDKAQTYSDRLVVFTDARNK